jgi:predicted PurR-regulated permease PerM
LPLNRSSRRGDRRTRLSRATKARSPPRSSRKAETQEQGIVHLTKQPEQSKSDRLIAEETSQNFVAVTETEGDITRGKAVGSVSAKKTYDSAADDPDEMPLPSDPKTVFLGGLFILACMTVLYVAAEIVLPLILAIVLKLLLQPLVRMLERIHIPRALGAVLSVLLVLLVAGGAISILAGPAAAWAGKLPEAVPKLRDSLGFLHEPIDAMQRLAKQMGIGGLPGTENGSAASTVKPGALVGAVLSGSAAATSGLFTTLLILFYMLVSGETFLRRMVEILPRFKDKRSAVELSIDIEKNVSAYLLTVSCINALVGAATGCVMWLCGVANPVLWGAVAFMVNFVPILGPMVGIVIFLMASVLSLGVTWWAVLPVGLYFCIHIIEGEIATPMLMAHRFTINPVAIILALIFWYWMWGVTGAILAVPLLAVTKIICDDLRPLRAFGHLLEG